MKPVIWSKKYLDKLGVLTSLVMSLCGGMLAPNVSIAAQPFVDVAGAQILSQTQLTPRTVALAIRTPLFAADTVVEVILPTGYAADQARRWPVTYYLAGTNTVQSTFRETYKGEDLTVGYPSIIVALRGDSGYLSDWFNLGAGGPPMYETFVKVA